MTRLSPTARAISRRTIAQSGLVLLAPLSAVLTACSSKPPPPPPPPPAPPPPKLPPVVTIKLTGGADQNPDVNGEPAPVGVRVFELSGTSAFERADVFALMDHEQQTLGADYVASQAFVLSPSERKTITINPKPDVTAIGVAAFFRAIDDAQWRADAAVAPNGPTNLSVDIGKLAVTLTPSP